MLVTTDLNNLLYFDLINTVKYKNRAIDCIVVAPRGDMSGVTDTNNIENSVIHSAQTILNNSKY